MTELYAPVPTLAVLLSHFLFTRWLTQSETERSFPSRTHNRSERGRELFGPVSLHVPQAQSKEQSHLKQEVPEPAEFKQENPNNPKHRADQSQQLSGTVFRHADSIVKDCAADDDEQR